MDCYVKKESGTFIILENKFLQSNLPPKRLKEMKLIERICRIYGFVYEIAFIVSSIALIFLRTRKVFSNVSNATSIYFFIYLFQIESQDITKIE